MLRKKGQSTLEYVLVLTAIIGAIMVAAQTIIRPGVSNTLNSVTNQMETQVSRINFATGAAHQ